MGVELNILLWMQENLRTAFLDPIMVFISSLGDKGAIWILLGVALLLTKKYRKAGVMVLVALLCSLVIGNGIIKHLVNRIRPFDAYQQIQLLIRPPGDSSFPSAHTMSSFAAAGAIFLNNRELGIPALILAALIAYSRMYLFLHYPSDIAAGFVIGLCIAWGVAYFFTQRGKMEHAGTS